MKEKTKLLEKVYARVPYSNQIKNLDLMAEENAIRFDWRGSRYRVDLSGQTEECIDGILSGNDTAILMRTLIQGYLP